MEIVHELSNIPVSQALRIILVAPGEERGQSLSLDGCVCDTGRSFPGQMQPFALRIHKDSVGLPCQASVVISVFTAVQYDITIKFMCANKVTIYLKCVK